MELVYSPQVCQVVASVNEYTGGTAILVAKLTEQLCGSGVSCHLFTLNYQHRGKQLLPRESQIHSYPATFLSRHLRGFHPQASQALQQLASNQVDLIHNHGLWMLPNIYARQAALVNHIPLIISPHGMLESWSLNHNRARKQLAWLLYEQKNLKSATVLHATSAAEVSSIRYLDLRQPIAVVPSGVDLPDYSHTVARGKLIQIFPELANKQWLLFLSRLHPKKGLEDLLHVWKELFTQFPDWHLIIAGPDSVDGYQSKLKLLVDKLSLNQQVTFTGMITGQLKDCALGNSSLFVLPTHSENFGIAVAEALAHGIPVITTKAAPWQEIEQQQCGWWIEDNRQALLNALIQAMELSEAERSLMGKRGRALIETQYSWSSVAQKMVSVYQWILGGGEPPECIHF